MPAKDGDRYTIFNKSADTHFAVECVVSPSALQKGLSGRKSLPSGTGMLFVFPTLSLQTMWMPDMHFPLDVVWLDETLSVTNISYGLQPCASRSFCPNVSSVEKVKYAIEMPEGDAHKYGFALGQNLGVIINEG
jgi:uncharacterized protein